MRGRDEKKYEGRGTKDEVKETVGACDTSYFVVRNSYFSNQGFAGLDLIHKEGDYRASGGHHVAVAGAAGHGSGAVEVPGAGNHYLLAQRLRQ